MKIVPLEWDSQFFKLKIGKIETDLLTENYFSNLLNLKEKLSFDLIYLFSNNIININTKQQIFLADQKVTYLKNVCNLPIPTTSIKEYKGAINNDLIQLAIESGHLSRFKKDRKLNSHFIQFYSTWLKKSLNGQIADKVYVSYLNNKITGFITVSNNKELGKIGLIAVNEKYRGKGFGTQLLAAAENWCRLQNIQTCEVITQLDNFAACRLYENFGYNIKTIQYIYHV